MKNTKLFARIFALSIITILLLALSLPCFADTNNDIQSAFIARMGDYAQTDAFQVLLEDYPNLLGYNTLFALKTPTSNDWGYEIYPSLKFPPSGRVENEYSIFIDMVSFIQTENGDVYPSYGGIRIDGYGTLDDGSAEIFVSFLDDDKGDVFVFNFVQYGDASQYPDSIVFVQADVINPDGDTEHGSLLIYSIGLEENTHYMNTLPMLLGGGEGSGNYVIYNPAEFARGYYSAPAPTPEPEEPEEPDMPNGWYGELFTIIKNAVFGENAVLDANQNFVLTQISLWLTLLVILLPLVVVAVILVRCFR